MLRTLEVAMSILRPWIGEFEAAHNAELSSEEL
jgi:hypothetical protein